MESKSRSSLKTDTIWWIIIFAMVVTLIVTGQLFDGTVHDFENGIK